MVKRLFLFAVAVMTTFTLTAQAQSTSDYSFSNYSSGGYSYGLEGATAGETYDVAMYVPGYLQGATITGISFRLGNAQVLSNVKAWVSASLPTSSLSADGECVSVSSPVSNGSTTVALTSAYTIPASGCYVGYSFTVNDVSTIDGQQPVVTDHNASYVRNFYIKGSSVNTSWAEERFANTSLSIDVDNLPKLTAAFDSRDLGTIEQSFLIGESATVSVPFIVTGTTAVTRLSYTIKDLATGKVSSEISSTCSRKKFGNVSSFKIKLAAGETEGISQKEITITKLNNKALDNTNGTTGVVTVKTFYSATGRTVLEEQFTATSTPWDVRGITGMEYMDNNYNGKWIGIAVHADEYHYADPMYCADYRYVSTPSSYPAAKLNRGSKTDPYFGSQSGAAYGIAASVDAAAARPSEGSIKVSAAWTDHLESINVSASAEFLFDRTDAPYAIGYVLVGNGLKATTTAKTTAYPWYQYNSYYGSENADENLREWDTAGELHNDIVPDDDNGYYIIPVVTDMTYNHVALKAKGAEGGVSGSIAAPIVKGRTQTHTTSFDLTNGIQSTTWKINGVGENLLQDKTQLKVVALLLNTNTGEVLDAAQCDISGYATAVEDVSDTTHAEGTIVARYNVSGQQISTPTKGVNILKMSNGKTVKVLVK